jgi:hypothetical protein
MLELIKRIQSGFSPSDLRQEQIAETLPVVAAGQTNIDVLPSDALVNVCEMISVQGLG